MFPGSRFTVQGNFEKLFSYGSIEMQNRYCITLIICSFLYIHLAFLFCMLANWVHGMAVKDTERSAMIMGGSSAGHGYGKIVDGFLCIEY